MIPDINKVRETRSAREMKEHIEYMKSLTILRSYAFHHFRKKISNKINKYLLQGYTAQIKFEVRDIVDYNFELYRKYNIEINDNSDDIFEIMDSIAASIVRDYKSKGYNANIDKSITCGSHLGDFYYIYVSF